MRIDDLTGEVTVETVNDTKMITHCPYCRQVNEAVKYWHRRADNTGLQEPMVADKAATPEQVSFEEEEMVMFLPCEHSFRRSDIKDVTEAVEEVEEKGEAYDNEEPSTFDRKIAREKLNGAKAELNKTIEQANAHMERTPPDQV